MRIRELPSAMERREELKRRLLSRRPVVFLDYDGTLTPIVERPEDATLPARGRRALERLRGRCPVAVVSGRDLQDVRRMVGVDGIWYAGSHGFDIVGPGGEGHRRGEEYLPALETARRRLAELPERFPGVRLEAKAFALAVHWREAREEHVEEVEAAVDRVVADERDLRKTGGKRIFELRPNLDWHKGRALLWLLRILEAEEGEKLPLYVGDDLTDEDAFRAIRDRGVGIVVRGEDDDRATAAHYAVESPERTAELLEMLSAVLEG